MLGLGRLRALVCLFVYSAAALQAAAQENVQAEGSPMANWAASCSSPSRLTPLECAMEQRVMVRETGQQLARLVIKTGSDQPRAVSLLIQLPLGISTRNGVKLIIDNEEVSQLDIQTCDATGCFAGTAVSPDLLDAMKGGKDMRVELQNLQQKPFTINFLLAGFSATYANVE